MSAYKRAMKLQKEKRLMDETLREVILAFDSTTAIVLFSPTMVVVAVWHEIRERRRGQQ
jgi:hypothetical protein